MARLRARHTCRDEDQQVGWGKEDDDEREMKKRKLDKKDKKILEDTKMVNIIYNIIYIIPSKDQHVSIVIVSLLACWL